MKSLSEWREEQLNEMGGSDGQNPMDVVQQTMARIAPMVQLAHQQIEAWPEEREKSAARRTLDAQLLKASRDQWMGKAKMASQRMGRGMDAARAMKQFGGISTTAANQLSS
jgi:hypothetical protein